jgi:polysaccharide pyruvyl transferase WcaK-like protein
MRDHALQRMTSSTRLLIIADVGGAQARHIGDEAMFEANLDALRRLIPGVAFTVMSRDPVWTAARYGVEVVAPFGFPRAPSSVGERRALLDRLLADATSRARGNTTTDALSDSVAGADAIVISGGGSLSAAWPDLLYERAALLLLARIFGKPSVVLGQTIGPRLAGDERRLLAESLPSARFVGVRELPSAALALELGVAPERIWYQSDDALFLQANLESAASERSSGIVVTIDPQVRAAGGEVFGSLVSQLRELSEITREPLTLVPHVYGNESAAVPSDLAEARLIAEGVGLSQTVVAEGLDTRRVRRIVDDATLVVSSRYHPVVFGLAAAVPTVGIYGDQYCRIKLQGALAHARRERWALTYEDVARGDLLTSSLELWHARGEVRRELESCREAWRAEYRERWDAVLRALDPAKPLPPAADDTMFGRPVREVAPALVSALEAGRRWWQCERESFENLAVRHDEAQRRAGSLQEEIGARRAISRRASAIRSKLWRRRP